MLELTFYIVGGYIEIEQKAFLQEMLGKDSCLRQLLNRREVKGFAEKHPIVSEPDEKGIVTIDFNYTVHVELKESAMEHFSKLKARYRERIRGRICCRWLAGYSMSNFTIDLDSNDDQVRQGD